MLILDIWSFLPIRINVYLKNKIGLTRTLSKSISFQKIGTCLVLTTENFYKYKELEVKYIAFNINLPDQD